MSRDFASGVATLRANRCAWSRRTTTYGRRSICESIWRSSSTPTLKITRSTRILEEERGHGVVLDLGEVNLVDVDVVRFLVDCETQGIRLAQCPAYVQKWMAREKRLP